MAAESAMQKIQAETQSKMQIKQAEVAFEIEKLKNEAELKRQLMQTEFDFNMQLRGYFRGGVAGQRGPKREG